MGQKVATLEIELAMATGGAISDVTRFGGVVDKVSAQAIRDLDKIDAATKQIGDTTGAVAGVNNVAKAIRDAATAAREYNKIERSGEAMVGRLDREIAAYGKTASELRGLKAETLALDAARKGQLELAERIRAKEAQLYDMEFAAARKARLESEAIAEQRAIDAAAAEREAQAIRDAAAAHALFEAKVRQGAVAMREAETAAAALAREVNAQQIRDAAAAHAIFEAKVRQGAAAMREADAAAAAFEQMIGRVTARVDPSASALARLDMELSEAKRAFDAARISGADFEQEQTRIVGAIGRIYGPQRQMAEGFEHGRVSAAQLRAGTQQLSYQIGDVAASFASGTGFVQIFGQQVGQTVQAMSLMQGEAKGLIGFLGGPWGAVLTGAVTILATLASKHFEAEKAVRGHKTASEQLADAIRQLDQATGLSNKSVERSVALHADSVQQKVNDAIATRNLAQQELNLARSHLAVALAQRDGQSEGGLDFGTAAAATEERRVKAIKGTVDALQQQIDAGQRSIAVGTVYSRVMRSVAAETSVAERANQGYDKSLQRVRDQLEAGTIREDAAKAEVRRITRLRDTTIQAAEDTARASTKAHREAESAAKRAHNEAIKAAEQESKALMALVKSAEASIATVAKLRDLTPGQVVGNSYASLTGASTADLWGFHSFIADRDAFVNARIDAENEVRATQDQNIHSLSDTYLSLFQNGSGNIWSSFKHLGEQAIAELAAKFTLSKLGGSPVGGSLSSSLGAGAGGAFGSLGVGAGIGSVTGSLVTALGVKGSATGAAIGGALGTAVGGPLGAAIGGALGSFVGGLLKTTKKASTTIGLVNDQLDILATAGNSASRKQATMAAGTSLLEALSGIADQLGGALGALGSVSIGVRKKDYVIDPTGAGRTKGAGVLNFGADQEAAIRAALSDLIADGAITGISEAQSRLLKGGGDLQKQLQKALDFGSVFDALKQELDPTGYAIDQLDKQFAALRRTFDEAAASADERAQLEQLYQIKRDAITADTQVSDALEKLNDHRRLEVQLMEAQGDAAGALALQREIELSTTDDSLKALQQQVWAAQDAQAATAAAAQAEQERAQAAQVIATERAGLEQQLLQLQGDTAALRARELAGLDESNRALQERVYALQDEQAAQAAAAQAAAEAATKLAAVASERTALEQQLLQLEGNTAELRARELAALDATNRPLQERIYALQDEQAAAATAAQAEADAATKLSAIASERAGLEQQLLQLGGDVAAVRERELQALDATNRPLQERIYALQDEQAATAAAAQAAADAASKLAAIATERTGLEQQLLQLQGDTAALRARELAALDASNRGIQERIYALQDEQAASAAAAQAAADAAAKLKGIADERSGLERQLLQLRGDTAALRALELDGLDESNRALQRQIYALQDAQEAAKAADALRQAWQSVGDTIMDEVKRIRGLTDATGSGSFATLMGQFNAANALARSNDPGAMDAAKSLPQLSKSLLDAAERAATSRQELDRVQAMTAASLEATYGLVTAGLFSANDMPDAAAWPTSAPAITPASVGTSGSNDKMSQLRAAVAELTAKVRELNEDMKTGLAAIASGTNRTARILDNVTSTTGGDSIAVSEAAA